MSTDRARSVTPRGGAQRIQPDGDHLRIARRPLLLRHRIVASVLIGLALVLVIAGAVVVWTIRDSSKDTYRDRVSLAQEFAQRVNDDLAGNVHILEHESSEVTLDPGRPLTEDQQQNLDDLRAVLGNVVQISVMDRVGAVIWTDPHAPSESVTQPAASLSSSQPALRDDRSQVSACTSSLKPDQLLVCLTVPLNNAQGDHTGVLIGAIDPASFVSTSLLTKPGYPAIHVELIDGAGHDIAGTGEYFPGAGTEHQQLLASLVASQTAGYRIHNPPSTDHMPNHLVAYAPVPLLPSWGVVLEEPQDNALALQRHLTQRLGMVALATLVLGTLAAWLDVRRVVGPLKDLTSTAERFALGQLDEPIHLARDDELGILAGAFEAMRKRLRASLAEVEQWNRELEKRVDARTVEVEARNRDLAQLNALAETVSGSLDLRTMLDRALDRIFEMTGADAGCLLVPDERGSGLTVAAVRPAAAILQIGQSCPGDCLCGRALRLNQLIVSDGQSDTADAGICPAFHPRSSLAVPLAVGEQVHGILFLASMDPAYFQQKDLVTLSSIGRQVGLALANARLYQDLREREHDRAVLLQQVMNAQEEERRRLAQELHDETSQALASLRFGLERLGTETDVPEPLRDLAIELQNIATQTLDEVHRLSVELRPNVLDDLGLVAAIERNLQECEQRTGLTVDFAAIGVDDLRLLLAAETAIYRIVQAAITNVVQHAQATHLSVLLNRRGKDLVVIVEDDGCGFDLSATYADALEARLGLAGMQERASLIKATLTFETQPGTGTTVFLEVPIDLNRDEGATHGDTTDRARR